MTLNDKFLWNSEDIFIVEADRPLTPDEIAEGRELLDEVEKILPLEITMEEQIGCSTIPVHTTTHRSRGTISTTRKPGRHIACIRTARVHGTHTD